MLAENAELIRDLISAIGRPSDLNPHQWAQLMAMVMEFRPDLVIELGRGYGNSTAAFVAALGMTGRSDARIVSLCISKDWRERTGARVADLVPPAWLAPLEALETDILTFDFDACIGNAQRVLVFWDAHGYDIAGCVLGRVLPALADRPHVVAMHDISDARYMSKQQLAYAGSAIWTGGTSGEGPRVTLGHVSSAVEQSVAVVDFATRNAIALESADHSLRTELTTQQVEELEQLGELFSLQGHWFYFTLVGAAGPLTYPRPTEATIEVPMPAPAPVQRGWARVRSGLRWRARLLRQLLPARWAGERASE